MCFLKSSVCFLFVCLFFSLMCAYMGVLVHVSEKKTPVSSMTKIIKIRSFMAKIMGKVTHPHFRYVTKNTFGRQK